MKYIEKILARAKQKGAKFANFKLKLPNKEIVVGNATNIDFTLSINSRQVYLEVLRKGDLGLGEQYMQGNIEITGNKFKAFRVGAEIALSKSPSSLKTRISQFILGLATSNRPNQALKNIAHHYDLGNDFYQKWLDESMTYSCAYFQDTKDTLEQAQDNKHELIMKKLQVSDGDRLLDIGCGWGSLLVYAAKRYDVQGVGVTLSEEQLKYARNWAKEAGVADKITFKLQDYRDLKGTFNKIVSVGMFEHVGKNYHEEYFATVYRLLEEGGLTLVHTIGKTDLNGDGLGPWVTNYIFPGAYLPLYQEVCEPATKYKFQLLDIENLRPHYALTLTEWIKRYQPIFDETADKMGIEFARMWEFYLHMARANFACGRLQHHQFLFSKHKPDHQPLTRKRLTL